MNSIISLVVLIFSAIVHEVSHGLAAEKLGDSTARDEGRITLNPIPHIDVFGSILLPLMLIMAGSPVVLGSAKPVPVDFYSLKPRKLGMILVSLAGPLSNFFLAILFALPFKLGLVNQFSCPILLQVIQINLVLGIFNLLPIPPLDGSKVLAGLLNDEWVRKLFQFEQYGFILILLFVYSGLLGHIYLPVLKFFFLFTGIPFYCSL